MSLDQSMFYDEGRMAIMPIGLCNPDSEPAGGYKTP
jgi:hypothetical protein